MRKHAPSRVSGGGVDQRMRKKGVLTLTLPGRIQATALAVMFPAGWIDGWSWLHKAIVKPSSRVWPGLKRDVATSISVSRAAKRINDTTLHAASAIPALGAVSDAVCRPRLQPLNPWFHRPSCFLLPSACVVLVSSRQVWARSLIISHRVDGAD